MRGILHVKTFFQNERGRSEFVADMDDLSFTRPIISKQSKWVQLLKGFEFTGLLM
jgi:hypothetical protein